MNQMIVLHYDPEQFRRKRLKRTVALLQELAACLQTFPDDGQPSPEQAERCFTICFKIFHSSDSDEVTDFVLRLMSQLRFVDGIDHEFWDQVYASALKDRVWEKHQVKVSDKTEYDLHQYLIANWDAFFGGSIRLVQPEFRIGPGRVDFLAEDDQGPVLIECKTGPINLKALNQLQNYLYNYGRGRGILIGSELQVKLPDGISFMPHRGLYLADGEGADHAS